MICIPLPESTAADRLIAADIVVLARENPDKPFSYLAVEVLKGELDDRKIDLFVNSQTRRRLTKNPEGAVVLAFGGGPMVRVSGPWRDSPATSKTSPRQWQVLGYASPEYRQVVQEVLMAFPRWQGTSGLEQRAQFFIPYLSSTEKAVRELAYLEVGMASYDTIRLADESVSDEQVQTFLAEDRYLEWRSLFILLLGVNATEADREVIRTQMDSNRRWSRNLNLSAWAAALIEVDDKEAIDWLEANYLGDRYRKPENVEEILKAMSVHGNRKVPELRARIIESYGSLIRTQPQLAGWVARDLLVWGDWRYRQALDDLRQSAADLDSASAYAIDTYVRRAASQDEQPSYLPTNGTPADDPRG